MTDNNIINMPTPMNVLADKIRSAFHRTERGRFEWIEGTLELAVLLAEARARFPADLQFSYWIVDAELERINHQDRAALISMTGNIQLARIVLEETQRSSWRLIWEKEMKARFTSAGKPTSEPTNIPEPPVSAAPAQPIEQPQRLEPEIPVVPSALPPAPVLYDPPKKSKLYDSLGDSAANVLLSRFKHRIFPALITGGESVQKRQRAMLRYLAERCLKPDYPAELFLSNNWTTRLLYPHLPQKLLDRMPSNLSELNKKHHITLVETETRFMLTPEFGVTDPPLAAFNKVYEIYHAVLHAKNGDTFDQSAVYRATYVDSEGKQPVIIRGTQLWPAETGTGYGYEDLRCAHGLADDILKTFDETRNAPLSTRSLKLRHVMSWLPGGYNSTGASLDGTMKALKAVVQAYGANKSDVMRSPSPSLKKLDEV